MGADRPRMPRQQDGARPQLRNNLATAGQSKTLSEYRRDDGTERGLRKPANLDCALPAWWNGVAGTRVETRPTLSPTTKSDTAVTDRP